METKEKEGEKTKDWKDRLDALKFSATPHSPMGKEITSDATLAVLNQKDKEGIANMRDNMEQALMIQDMIYETYIQRKNITEHKELKKSIEKQKARITRLYLIQPYMIMILNRNIKDNPMLQILGDIPEEQTQQLGSTEQAESGFWKKLTNRLKNEEER